MLGYEVKYEAKNEGISYSIMFKSKVIDNAIDINSGENKMFTTNITSVKLRND